MRLILSLLIFFFVAGSFQSCVSKKKFDELQAAKEATDRALAETQSQLQTLKGENDKLKTTLESETNRLNGEISSIRKDLDATKGQMAQVQEKLNMTEAELNKIKAEIAGIFGDYEKSGLKMEERDGRLYVITSTPVNYKTGSASLTRAQRKAIDELAQTLKNNPKLRILVEGHTDNKKFKSGSGMDNWDLSVARSMSVVRELLKRGVAANQVAAVGRGENMPVDDNNTAAGRSKNRRSEIAPDPNLGNLIKGGN